MASQPASPRVVVVGEAELAALVRGAVRTALEETKAAQAAPPPALAATLTEAAKRFNRSVAYFRRAADMKLVRTVMHGGRRIIPADEIARLLQQGLPSTGTGKRIGPPPKPKPKPAGQVFGEGA